MELEEMQNLGELILKFNETLNTNVDQTNMSFVINITVMPDEERAIFDNFDPTHLKIDWKVLYFTNDTMAIQVTFE